MRAFLAVELDETLRAAIRALQAGIRREVEPAANERTRISWTSPASMHLTIKFLGDIDETLKGPLRETIAPAVSRLSPVELPLERLGGFPSLREPRALWIGPPESWSGSTSAAHIQEIHHAVDDACASLGLPRDDRPYNPHLTLARVRSGERRVGQVLHSRTAAPVSIGALHVGALTLFESHLESRGAIHTSLWHLTLATS